MISTLEKIREARSRLDIPAVWTALCLPGEMPRRGTGVCRSPFRPDKHPSFSIYDGGQRWKDQASGEGGDVIDFIARAEGRERRDAIHRFLEMAGVPAEAPPPPPRRRAAGPAHPDVAALRWPTDEEVEKIARLRRLDPRAVLSAACFGTLRAGRYKDYDVWGLVDGPPGERPRLAEVRTFDGTPIPTYDCPEGVKSLTLRGSKKDWPIGASALAEPGPWRAVLLCEGMPDYLAAFHFAWHANRPDLCPVTMLGRKNNCMHPQAAALLKDRRIRAFAHADADGGGRAAMEQWIAALPGVAGDIFDFKGLRRCDGRPVNDLNDAAMIHPENAPDLDELLPC